MLSAIVSAPYFSSVVNHQNMNVEKESVKKKEKHKKKDFRKKKKIKIFQPPLPSVGIVGGGDQWNNFLYFHPDENF